MNMDSFFRDTSGRLVIVQSPNALIFIWFVLSVANTVSRWNDHALSSIADMLLFTWAYLELVSGKSPFRKSLGAAVLAYLMVKQFS